MKKCLVYGNCQIRIIENFLSSNHNFVQKYEFIKVKPVHLLEKADIPLLKEIHSQLDLFIHQPIHDNYKGIFELSTNYWKEQLREECKKISFPVIYFSGYNPELFYLKNIDNTHFISKFDYHDKNIVNLFYEGYSAKEIEKKIKSPEYYSNQDVHHFWENSLATLEKREQDLDLKIVPFIKENGKRLRLFHTMNHPNKNVMKQLVLQIFGKLDIQYNQELETVSEVLNQTVYPVYPSIVKHLGIYIKNNNRYIIKKKKYSIRNVIKTYCKLYKNNSKVIEYNVQLKEG